MADDGTASQGQIHYGLALRVSFQQEGSLDCSPLLQPLTCPNAELPIFKSAERPLPIRHR